MSKSSRERMRAVLSGELPDRVPFFPTIYIDHACVACGKQFDDALIDPSVGQECMLGAALRYQTDTVRFCMGPPQAWYDEKVVVHRDEGLAQVCRRSGRVEGYFDVAGGGAFRPLEPERPIRTVDEARNIPVPSANEYLEQGCFRDVARGAAAAHDRGLFVVGMCGKQTIGFMAEAMGGSDHALMLFYDDADLAYALIAKAVAISIEKGKAFIASGVDCIYIGDSYASASVISPDVYRRFCVPAYAEAAQEFRRQGVFCYKHCCGNYNPLLEDLVSTGVDAMDGIDPTSGMSVGDVKRRIGSRLTLMGGISCLTLLNGSAEQVYEESRQCVLAGKEGGRYVLGSACAVPRYTPPENLMAARAAAVEHGTYGET